MGHLFVSECDGALYDLRHQPMQLIRRDYKKSFRTIDTVAQFKATLRAGEFTFPGAYQLYFITDDGAAVSFDGARDNYRLIIDSIRNRLNDGHLIVGCEINYEDCNLYCAATGNIIPASYGE